MLVGALRLRPPQMWDIIGGAEHFSEGEAMGSYVRGTMTKDERILYEAKISLWTQLPLILLGAIGLLFMTATTAAREGFGAEVLCFTLGILPLIVVLIRYKTTELSITNKRVIAKFGFIRRHCIEMRLEKVESIQVQQGIGGRIFNYGSLIVSGAGNPVAPVPRISNPLRFRRKVLEAQDQCLGLGLHSDGSGSLGEERMASRLTRVGVVSLTGLIAVAAFIVFSSRDQPFGHSASTPTERPGKTQPTEREVPVLNDASTPTERPEKTQPTEAAVPVLNEQGMELVTYLLLDDMNASIRGVDTLLTAEDTLHLAGIDLKTTAEQYDADYDANEVAADQKYAGKKILLTGVVESINKDFKGDAYLVLKASNPFMGVHAELNDRGKAGASALAKGTTIYLVCDSGARIVGSAVARNCQQFSQHLDQIRPSLKSALEKRLQEQSSTPTKLAQVLRGMYVVGTELPPDSPCFTGTDDDACKASLAAITGDKAKMQALADQVRRTFPSVAAADSTVHADVEGSSQSEPPKSP